MEIHFACRFVLDATVNPDFSQIESDQPQITVNQRFEVFFPEKRPFFLENSNYFTTPINVVFTRDIGHPEYGLAPHRKIRSLGGRRIGQRRPRSREKSCHRPIPTAVERATYTIARREPRHPRSVHQSARFSRTANLPAASTASEASMPTSSWISTGALQGQAWPVPRTT